jgi:hypothetical protein
MSTPEFDPSLKERADAVHAAASALTRAVNAAAEVGLEVEIECVGKVYESGVDRRVYHATVRQVTEVRY